MIAKYTSNPHPPTSPKKIPIWSKIALPPATQQACIIPNMRITVSLFLTCVLVLPYSALVVQIPTMTCSWSILELGVKRIKEHLFLKHTVFVFSCIWWELLVGSRVELLVGRVVGGGPENRNPRSLRSFDKQKIRIIRMRIVVIRWIISSIRKLSHSPLSTHILFTLSLEMKLHTWP